MKDTPSSILTALAADLSEPYLLLEIVFSGSTLRLTDLPYNVTVGGNVYTSDGGLTKLSPPQLTSVADREVYRIELIDFNNEFKTHFDAGAVGSDVTVSLGIEGNTTDIDIVYKGRIDGATIETNPSEGTKVAVIECSSPFGALDRTNERLTRSDQQKKIDATDTCFDRVYQSVDNIQIRWGKKP